MDKNTGITVHSRFQKTLQIHSSHLHFNIDQGKIRKKMDLQSFGNSAGRKINIKISRFTNTLQAYVMKIIIFHCNVKIFKILQPQNCHHHHQQQQKPKLTHIELCSLFWKTEKMPRAGIYLPYCHWFIIHNVTDGLLR